MLGFLIQRLLQALVVMLVISLLVFAGVYAIGNPIDVLISPDATPADPRADDRAPTDSIGRCGGSISRFLGRLFSGDFGRSFVFNMPVLDLIFSRLPATLELTLIAVLGATLIGVPLGIYAGYRPDAPPRQGDHGGLDPRLLGADLLDRPGADLHLRGDARLAAGRRARRDRGSCSASSGAS